jgi:hypothetical protein
MQPGTRMPQVFPDGQSLLPDVLAGHADQQAAAMWAYWSLGPGLALPDGLQSAKARNALPVDVTDRPVVLRTFMPDAGARAIAIGFPGGVSFAFDAANCRLAYAWSGNFLDAAPVWEGRGGAPARPLGPRFWTGPAGYPWAMSAGSSPPDFGARANDLVVGPPRPVHFMGYELDTGGTPTFKYRVDADGRSAMTVREQCGPLNGTLTAGFELRLPARHSAWLLVADAGSAAPVSFGSDGTSARPASQDENAADRAMVTARDGQTTATILTAGPADVRWQAVRDGQSWKLLLHIPPASDARTVRLRLKVWAVPGAQPGLIKALLAK